MYPSTFNEAAGIFVHDQVKELIRQGCEVKVVSPVPWVPSPLNLLSDKWKLYSSIPHRAEWEGVDVYYPRYIAFPRDAFFASSGRRVYLMFKNLANELQKHFHFDLIHAHVALPDGSAAVLLGEELQKPVVVTIHGQDLYRTIHKSTKCKAAISSVFKKAAAVIMVSSVLKDLADKNLGFDSKTRVISNGVALDKVRSEYEGAERVQGKTILSASYLIPRKGIEFNLRAVSRLAVKYPEIRYKIIGGGPETDRLKKLASELDLAGRVEFLGHLSNVEVMKHVAETDVFSLPSWNEAFGVVYIEAMAHGKPVIGCKGEGVEDVVEHGKTGLLVKPRDVSSLAEAMDYLLSNPGKAKAMGERGKELVLSNFTWEKNAGQIIELYEQVISSFKRGPSQL